MHHIKKIDHVVITASDREKTARFYEKLGFTAQDSGNRYELFAGDFKINVHTRGSELQPHAANVQTGSADLCFECENLALFEKKLIENAVSIELGVVDRTGARGKIKSLYIRDPDKNLLEFCEYYHS